MRWLANRLRHARHRRAGIASWLIEHSGAVTFVPGDVGLSAAQLAKALSLPELAEAELSEAEPSEWHMIDDTEPNANSIRRLNAMSVKISFRAPSLLTELRHLAAHLWPKRSASSSRSLLLPPGTTVRAVLAFFCSRKAMAMVFDELFAAMQHEWIERHLEGAGRLQMFVLRLKWYGSIAAIVLTRLPLSLSDWVAKAWRSG